MNPRYKRTNKPSNETILIENNFDMSKITTRKAIEWDEIDFPKNWVLEGAVHSQPKINNKVTAIIQTSEGRIQIEFDNEDEETSLLRRTRSTRSLYSHISPLEYKVETSSRCSTYQLDKKINQLNIKENIVQSVYKEDPTASEINFPI